MGVFLHSRAMKLLSPFFAALCAASIALATPAAVNAQTLKIAFETAEIGFDLAAMDDLTSGDVINAVFDVPLRHDYFARPPKGAPGILAGAPTISEDGKLYTLRVQRGRYFSDHPAFMGKKRELLALGRPVLVPSWLNWQSSEYLCPRFQMLSIPAKPLRHSLPCQFRKKVTGFRGAERKG
jgi:hypothetical protein